MMPLRKILLIRPDMAGDVMLITPAISLIKEKYPQAEIDVWAQAYTQDLLSGNKDIHEVIINPSLSFLRKKKYDAAVHFYNEFPYALATLLAGIPIRIGDRAKIIFGWMYNYGIWQNRKDLTKHQVEWNIQLLKPLGLTQPDPPPKMRLEISQEQKAFLNNFLIEHQINSKDLVIGINPGIGRTSRTWMPERYAFVADYAAKNLGARIIITGTEKERKATDEILKKCHQPNIIDLVGKTNLSQLIAVMSRYDVFTSVDTGPLHIAAALGIPTVAIFPAKSLKPTEWGPWQTQHIIARKAQSCLRRCFPPKCHFDDCVRAITGEEVLSALQDLLAGKGNQTLEDSQKDWFQKSANILTNHEEIYSRLKNNHYRAIKTESNPSLFNLIGLIIKEDINILHWIGKRPAFIPYLAKLISTLFVSIPPLFILEKEAKPKDLPEILKTYHEHFNK